MRQRDDFEMVVEFAVHEKKWEVTEPQTADCFAHAKPLHDLTNLRVRCDQIDCALNLPPEPIAQTSTPALVPMNGVAKFAFRSSVGPNGFRHR